MIWPHRECFNLLAQVAAIGQIIVNGFLAVFLDWPWRSPAHPVAPIVAICHGPVMRMIWMILTALMTMAALPGLAQTPMTADQFDEYTRGKTLFYGSGGELYGVERYLEGRRVIWSFLDGNCQEGIWYEERDLICFVYENKLDPQCWSFSAGPDGLIARFENSDEATELYEAQEIGEDMLCYGPEVGV